MILYASPDPSIPVPYLIGETLQQYRMFPDLVKIVIGVDCAGTHECLKTDGNPTGIPRWKSESGISKLV